MPMCTHLPHCASCRRPGSPEPTAHRVSELETQSASALLEQYEARFGQHPLLSGGQTAAGLPSRQVADYLNDLASGWRFFAWLIRC